MTDEKKIHTKEELEAELAKLSPEEREQFEEFRLAYDRLMCLNFSQKLHANIEAVPGDYDHIKVEGQLMDKEQFADWIDNRLLELPQEDPARLA